jgi:hypothetical protein
MDIQQYHCHTLRQDARFMVLRTLYKFFKTEIILHRPSIPFSLLPPSLLPSKLSFLLPSFMSFLLPLSRSLSLSFSLSPSLFLSFSPPSSSPFSVSLFTSLSLFPFPSYRTLRTSHVESVQNRKH